jgi:hypothetical protein
LDSLFLKLTQLYRQRELKNGPAGCICRRPKPSFVSFDNRTTDRQTNAKALRLSRVERVEETAKTVRVMIASWAGAEILVNPYVKAVTAEHLITLNLFVAIAFRYSSGFVSSADSASQ